MQRLNIFLSDVAQALHENQGLFSDGRHLLGIHPGSTRFTSILRDLRVPFSFAKNRIAL